MNQITTLTFFRFSNAASKLWAFKMMQFAHKNLKGIEGQTFYKLMGSGKGDGFNPFPDWAVYSLLQVWEHEEDANSFFKTADIILRYREQACETWSLYLKNIRAAGVWSGDEPFTPHHKLDPRNPYLAVITRATIKSGKLLKFWSYVPASQQPLKANKGLIYTKGIGEIPIVQMATFSLWENEQAMKDFAYNAKEHQVAIKKLAN
jgi:hypothetical protein